MVRRNQLKNYLAPAPLSSTGLWGDAVPFKAGFQMALGLSASAGLTQSPEEQEMLLGSESPNLEADEFAISKDWGPPQRRGYHPALYLHPSAPGWGRQHHSQRDPPFVPSKRLPDWAALADPGLHSAHGAAWDRGASPRACVFKCKVDRR